MKIKMLHAALLAAFLLTQAAIAQVVSFGQQTVTVTNAIPATTTNAVTATVIDASRHEDVALRIGFNLTGSGTSAVAFQFQGSLDNSTFTTLGTLSLTASGTSTVSVLTNWPVGPIPYLKLTQIGNPNASAVTNLSVTYGAKTRVLRYRSP